MKGCHCISPTTCCPIAGGTRLACRYMRPPDQPCLGRVHAGRAPAQFARLPLSTMSFQSYNCGSCGAACPACPAHGPNGCRMMQCGAGACWVLAAGAPHCSLLLHCFPADPRSMH